MPCRSWISSLAAQSVGMPGSAFQVIVRLQAERIGLAGGHPESTRPAERLAIRAECRWRCPFRVGPLTCQPPPFAFHDRRAGELDPAHPGLRRIEHRIVELDRDLVGLRCHQLIELDRLAHHRIVEEGDVHGLVEPLEHLLGLLGQREQPGRGHVEAQREAHRKVRDARAARRSFPACTAQSRRGACAAMRRVPCAERKRPTGTAQLPAAPSNAVQSVDSTRMARIAAVHASSAMPASRITT